MEAWGTVLRSYCFNYTIFNGSLNGKIQQSRLHRLLIFVPASPLVLLRGLVNVVVWMFRSFNTVLVNEDSHNFSLNLVYTSSRLLISFKVVIYTPFRVQCCCLCEFQNCLYYFKSCCLCEFQGCYYVSFRVVITRVSELLLLEFQGCCLYQFSAVSSIEDQTKLLPSDGICWHSLGI